MENSDHVISPRHQRTGADTAQLPSQPDLNVIDSETSASLGHFDSNAKLNATSSSEEKDHSLEDPTKNNVSKRWKTTLLRIGPLAGICSLMLAVLSILVSLAVLMGSRGDSVASWDVPPSSWLAVCTAVGNQAIRFAAFQGVAIAWWMSASRGSTLGRLHSDWHAGAHIVGAVSAGRGMGWLGLACISSTLVAIDGPFMQRATTIVSDVTLDESVPLSVTLSPEIPTTSTGGYLISNGTASREAAAFNATIPSPDGDIPNSVGTATEPWFIQVIGAPWLKGSKLSQYDVVKGCNGLCHLKMKAPALVPTSCSSQEIPLDLRQSPNISYESVKEANAAPPIDKVSFIILPSLDVQGEQEKINLVTAYPKLNKCVGTLNMTACTLAPAIGEYHAIVDGDKNTLTLDKPIRPNISGLAQNAATVRHVRPEYGWYESTLAGIVKLASTVWSAYTVYYGEEDGVQGILPVNPQASDQFLEQTVDQCLAYSDPRDTVLESMNELMFYVGVLMPQLEDLPNWYFKKTLDSGLTPYVNVTGQLQRTREVFHTDLLWFMAAVIIEVVCIAMILPTYRGYWTLGRHVSFSPLEIAKAFDAQILASCNSNSSAREMARAEGGIPVQYGVVEDGEYGGASKLQFASPSIVKPPERGTKFDV